MTNKFSILLIIILIYSILTKKILKIPFKYYSTSQFFPNQSHPVTNKFMSQIIIEISIGTPPQKLNCSINLNTFYSLFLSHKIPEIDLFSYYNKSSSQTYNCTREQYYYWGEDFDRAEIFNDKIELFSLDNKNLLKENFTFLLIDGLGNNVPNEFYASGLIGLRLKNENNVRQIDENRFIYQIKKYGFIDRQIFYFDFDKNGENGYFVIGDEISINDDNYINIYAGHLYMPDLGQEWSFNFDNVYYGNNKIQDVNDCLIKTENGLIVGPTNYENLVKDFFNNENTCTLNKTKMGYATFKYYSCDKSFDEKKIENLIFELKSINFNFTLNGKDLFYSENGKKYFKIIFLNYNQQYWYLGREFLNKYKLRFDTDRKSIFIPLNKKNKNNIAFYNQAHFWIIFSLGIFIIILIIIIIIFLKKFPRKKRANELEDDEDYDYIQKKDNINENIN